MFLSAQSLFFSTQMTARPFCTLWDCLMVHVESEGEHRCWPHSSCSVTLCRHWWHIIVDTWLYGLFKCQEFWIHILMWSSLYCAPPPFVQELSLRLFSLFLCLSSSLSFSCLTILYTHAITRTHTHTLTLRPTQTHSCWIEIARPAPLPLCHYR